MTAVAEAAAPGRRTARLRGRVLRAVARAASLLPSGVAGLLADVVGELWYRLAPGRAEQGRRNLRRVASWLAAHHLGDDRVRRAAEDPRALERLLRAAFRQTAHYYLEVARTSTLAGSTLDQLVVETPESLDAALAGGPAIFVGAHFGAMELPAAYVARRTGVAVTVPMETIDDAELQAWFEETRGATGIRIVDLRSARRELLAALRRGEPIGLVGDRDLTGAGIEVEFFGAPAHFPIGPGLLAIETGAPVLAASVRRTGDGRYLGRVEPVPVPGPGTGSRRERLTAFLQAEAHAFERIIARAPEQWWTVFFPIWPDLAVEGRAR